MHVSFLGENVIVKKSLSETRYSIHDLQSVRFEDSRRQFYDLYLDFGYDALKVEIENYQQRQIEDFVQRVKLQARPHRLTTVSGGSACAPEEVGALNTAAKAPENIVDAIRDLDSKGSNKSALIVLAISLAAFAGLGYLSWDLEFVVLLAIAILIHEAGHLHAMRVFKYTNLKMLFLPFIGGVALGRSKDEDATKVALISIAGPLVGLASGYVFLAAWFFTGYESFFALASLSIWLNAFNLLPFIPLDGGHFLNETLFSRFPRAELAFGVLAVVGLGFIAFELESIVFGAFMLIRLLGLSRIYAFAKLAKRLREEESLRSGPLDEAKAQRIVGELGRIAPALMNPEERKALVVSVSNVWKTVNKKHPTVRATALLVALYGALILLVVPFSLGFLDGIRAWH